jgi:hypothetical protein
LEPFCCCAPGVGGGVNMLLARRFENAIAVEATGS